MARLDWEKLRRREMATEPYRPRRRRKTKPGKKGSVEAFIEGRNEEARKRQRRIADCNKAIDAAVAAERRNSARGFRSYEEFLEWVRSDRREHLA